MRESQQTPSKFAAHFRTLLFSVGLFCIFFPSVKSAKASEPYIAVGTAKTKKTVIAIPGILSEYPQSKQIQETLENDLIFMDLFKLLPSSAFLEKAGTGVTLEKFKMTDWSAIQTEFLLKTKLDRIDGKWNLEGHLYDVRSSREILNKRYVGGPSDLILLAHTLANQVVETLTQRPGIFLTKIAMSCDRTGKKEIYMMDFDGKNVKQVTQHRSIAFAPAWSPDGKKIAYSLYTRHKDNTKNIDLYEFNFVDNTIRLLSDKRGINSGAAYSPDGKSIALTMSFLNNPEIFILNPVTREATRITRSLGVDVDPSWSPDGKSIAYVSSQTGQPMIFMQGTQPGAPSKRLTSVGRYNATPSWSPTGNKIAFAGWTDRRFDIFIMNPDGSKIERLTKDQGNNEDPTVSPDGQFVAFSSNRAGQQNIYVMNLDGTFTKRLTFGLGNCVAPRWSANF